jgi:dTDP-4-dehydrorhamnose 3,5-epimerase
VKLERQDTKLPGCFALRGPLFTDDRGTFRKLLHKRAFEEAELPIAVREIYYTSSRKGVVRGLHFQQPPADHVKIVCCLSGSAFDVVVDLRLDSPTFGNHVSFQLTPDECRFVYIPKGMAHGFAALADDTGLLYLTSEEYAPSCDNGILWDSAGIDWPVDAHPILSPRDSSFAPLSAFDSPFRMNTD